MCPNTIRRLQWSARIALILTGISMLAFAGMSCQDRNTGKLETITLGLPALEQNALIYVAEQQGLFAQNNLKVVVKDYDSGVASIEAMLKGEVDALIAWQPYIHQIQKQVNGVVVLPAQSNQSVYGVLIGTNDWLKQHPDLLVRFLKSQSRRRLCRSASGASQSDRTKTAWL